MMIQSMSYEPGSKLAELVAERNALAARAEAAEAEVARLTAERDTLRARAVELERDLRHMTEERDTISSAWDELHAELTTARAQLDAAVQYEIAHKLRTGDYERIDTPPQE